MITSKLLRCILFPITIIWDWIYRLRRLAYNYGILRKEFFKVPIVSVGNLSFGGTGKSPMVMWIVKQVENQSKIPLVLTRGYKSSLESSSGYISSTDIIFQDAKIVGDEPLMIAKAMKKGAIVIGSNRSKNLKKYYDRIQADLVILDDGFQHLKIHRAFNLVLFDSNMDIRDYKTAPVGKFREGLSALRFADAIAFSRAENLSSKQFSDRLKMMSPYLRPDVIICKFKYKINGVYNLFDEKVFEADYLQGKDVISLTAIASPESFDQSLVDSGAVIVGQKVFKDHHFFSQKDVETILEEALRLDAVIITTKKDIVKLKNITQSSQIFYIDIEIDFISGEEALSKSISNILHLDSV